MAYGMDPQIDQTAQAQVDKLGRLDRVHRLWKRQGGKAAVKGTVKLGTNILCHLMCNMSLF
jgi:hypothetical protein